ncbi:AAA family ATPase [Micromonospora krabiensis]|uniref:helix-turn-helix transcriptional regulator n=1 Tax=Micromonospora krabiensis TaxID=307121 RepID=UPI00361F0C9B
MQITLIHGRDEERRAVRRLLDEAATSGGALVLHGEPGSGRSTLVDHAHRQATGFTVLAGAGLVEEAGLPYAGLQRLLDPVLDRAAALPAPQARLLRRALAGAGCPTERRLALCLAVLRLLATVARDRPLLCTVDDLDRGDRASAQALTFVARRLGRLPIAVLLTQASAPPAGLPSHRLRPLGERDAAALLADRLPEPPTPSVTAALTLAAGGNPQALVDLAATVTPEQCRGDEPPPGTPPVDGALGRAYRARLDQLPADTRRVVLLAALDEGGDPRTLVRAATAGGMTIAALAPAEVAGLVRVADDRVTFPHPLARAVVVAAAPLADRRAAHLLLAGVLTDGQRLRRALHRSHAVTDPDPALATELVEAVAALVDAEPGPAAEVAPGCDPAVEGVGDGRWAAASAALERAADLTGDPALAVDRRLTAARYAWWAGAVPRARRLLAGLGAGPVPPAVAARADLLSGEVELRCGRVPGAVPTLRAAADALAGGDRPLALAALARAGEAACFAGEQYRYADLARRARPLTRPGDEPATALLTAHLAGVAATLRGDHERAGPALRRVVVLGGRLAGPALTPSALNWAASAGLLVAVDGAAYRLADRAVTLARATGELSALPRALELRAIAEYWLGRHEAAAETSRDGLRLARATGQANWVDVHLGMLAVLAAVRADRDTSLRRVREMRPEPAPGSRPHALAAWALAVLDLVDGRHAEAADRLASLARPGSGRGQVLVQVMATPYLVEAAAHQAHRAAATAALAVFDRWASSTASPTRHALSARCHALLAPRGSAEAEDAFRTALRTHPAEAGPFERARTALLFGRELRRGRRPRDARAHLHDAWGTFTLVGATAWAEQATAELRAAGESVGVPDPAAARLLTGQQLRIARLVAEGATNREVAARMFLSTRTVDHHLRNIFHRLGVRSRTELARALS